MMRKTKGDPVLEVTFRNVCAERLFKLEAYAAADVV